MPRRSRVRAVAALAFLLSACDSPQAELTTEPVAGHATPVRVAEVLATDAAREMRLPGVVRATQRSELAFLHAGYLAERFVARGDRVAVGERLASLQNPALGPALAAAEARVRELDQRLRQLDADHERARELHSQGLASAEVLDRTLADRNAAREARAQALAGVTEARDQLGDAVLRAPYAGTISDLRVEPGDFVQAGQPVLSLAGELGLEVEVQLPEGLARLLAPGLAVDVRAVGSARGVDGVVREIGLAREARPAPAVISLQEAADWEPGISVHVTVTHAAEPALTVPLGAIVDPGTGRTRVFRVVDDRAVLVPVSAGRLIGARVEVVGALSPGDRVVIAGHQQLLDGEAVRVLP
jgi:RND family efflux transporter MFP subunit